MEIKSDEKILTWKFCPTGGRQPGSNVQKGILGRTISEESRFALDFARGRQGKVMNHDPFYP